MRPLLVVLDQFEDYFLYHPAEDGEGTFAVEFPRLVNELNLRVNFVLSLREDAWAKLDQFEGQIPTLFANYIRVEHLNRQAARAAIVGPVEEWNRRLPPGEEPYTVEPALVESVIGAAAAGRLGLTEGGGADDPGEASTDAIEAPFLQLVLERLWRATVEAGAHTLDLARLEGLGGAQQIVENHLLEALGNLTPAEQSLAADLFRFLVTRSKTKIAHPSTDLAEWTKRPEPEVKAVLDKLCRGESGRIVRPIAPPPGETATSYELFHDVLAEPIQEWRRTFERERDRRLALQRFLKIGGALALLVVVFAALGILAYVQRNHARQATARATSVALGSNANNLLDTRPDVSLLLSVAAYEQNPDFPETSSMLSALEAARRSGASAILHGHAGAVWRIAFSPDGRTLATPSADGTVRLWNVRTHSQIGEPFRGHTDQVLSAAFSPDGKTLATSSADGAVRLWDVATHEQLGKPLLGHTNWVYQVAFSPDGKTLASASTDDTVRLWDVGTRKSLGPSLQQDNWVWSVAFSPDGRTLAAADEDRTIWLWRLAGGHWRHVQTLRGHTGPVWNVAFSPDGRTLASASLDKTVRLWNLRTYAEVGPPLEGHTDGVESVAFSPDGRRLLTASDDETARLWDVRTHREIGSPLRGHTDWVLSAAFDPKDANTVATGSVDTTARLWNLRLPTQFGQTLRGHRNWVWSAAFSPDGKTLATGSSDRTVRLWNVSDGRSLQTLGGFGDPVWSVAFSPDGGTLATALAKAGADTVWVWTRAGDRWAHTGTLVSRHESGEDGVRSVAFGPHGDVLATAGSDGAVRLWARAGGRWANTDTLEAHRGRVWSVAFSPDGNTLAAGGEDGTVQVWTLDNGHWVRKETLDGNTDIVYSVAFSPDGRTLATANHDATVRLWDVRSGEQVGQPLHGHTTQVLGMAFSPNGRLLASAGDDRTVRLWDVPTRTQLGLPLAGGSGPVNSVAFSPDGHTLAAAGDDTTVRLWRGMLWRDLPDLRALACGLASPLTADEWKKYAPGLDYRRTTC